jgi:tRNA A-37 threonylcarbamoyl transferase component Bud32
VPDSSADRRNTASPPATEAMHPASPLDTAAELVRVLDQYMADLKSATAPDRAKLLADHPKLAAQLEPCLAGIEFIYRAARPASSPTQLGDFRIVRELGRGGMGVVYEAEQISLRRRVALKVLRFGAVADKEALERFRREAETVAHLHHTNIVPIFAVGAEQGVSYYAMQYIEGGSLADAIAAKPEAQESHLPAKPTSYDEFARWGLEAAEALAHAHQRGVIHRDMKPSNLLLDTDGQVWLTDFGLARRMDEVTMTMSGMLMGTPRYMSPEQATAVKQPVDHRTDIYSLGATLYELVTGQPAFASDTPHGVISQILTAEPVRPRNIHHAIPRDLETITLKCLAKEPGQRYATAQLLADDLRAFREGRAINARRAGLPERTVRWVKQRKKSVAVAIGAAAATLLVVVALYAGLSSVAASRLAHLSVNTKGPPLKVEVLDEDESTAVATFTAPTQEAQTIAPGHYRVRLSADCQLSETSLFDADKGRDYDLTVALPQRDLWEIPVQNGESDEFARIDGHEDLFLAATHQLRRLDGATGQPVWQVSLTAKDQPLVAKVLANGEANLNVFGPRFTGIDVIPPCLLRPLVDLDGDGTPDLIWGSRATASLVAVSGKSGKALWCHRSRTTLPEGLRENDIQAYFRSPFHETVVGQPLAVEIGGRKIVVAICSVSGEHYVTKNNQWIAPSPQLWLDAVDARTGETQWRHPLPSHDELPEQTSFTATVGALHDRKIGAIAYGNRLFGFDFLTGQSTWPDRQLDDKPPVVVRFADLMGDGQLDVLFVREGATNKNYNPDGQTHELSLVALSPLSDKPLWEMPLPDVTVPPKPNSAAEPQFDWPLVVDLEGKGKPAIVVPFVDYAAGVCGVESLEGASSKSRWRQPLSGAVKMKNCRAAQPDRIVVGPDLDGDGYHELFVASRDQQTYRVYVDALSGRDGRGLWTYTRAEISFRPFGGSLLPLRWWQAGADGWPMLVVTGAANQYQLEGKPWSVILAASSGSLVHMLNDFGPPEVADLNGDGIPDLFARRADQNNQSQPYAAGKLRAIKGTPPEAWRMLSNDSFIPVPDLDGDGFGDLVHHDVGLHAISGRDGSLLWQNAEYQFALSGGSGSVPLQLADLDGDGVHDFLSISTSWPELTATSGRNGKLLWSTGLKLVAGELPCGAAVSLGGHVMEAGQLPDVLLLHAAKTSGEDHTDLQQLWLARISGRDGQVRWQQPLSEPSDLEFNGCHIPLATADLDGDGVNDIVFWMPLSQAEAQRLSRSAPDAAASAKRGAAPGNNNASPSLAPRYELLAVSGRDGKLLWRRPGFFMRDDAQQRLTNTRLIPKPVIVDLDGSGQPVVIITDVLVGPGDAYDKTSYSEVVALDGRDGKVKWTWRGDSGDCMGVMQDCWTKGAPQVVRTAAGKAIAVSIYDFAITSALDPKTKLPTPSGKSGQQIVVLDPRGQVLRRTDIKPYGWLSRDRAKIFVHDLNGDGHDELVWADVGRVRTMRPGDEKCLWEWPSSGEIEPSDYVFIQEIQPAGKTYPATAAISTNDGLIGLAGPTGKVCWRFDTTVRSVPLSNDDTQGLPRIWTVGPGSQRICGIALPTNDAGRYQPLTPQVTKYDEPVQNPRLPRPLPWAGPQQVGPWGSSLFGIFLIALVGAAIVGGAVGKRPGKTRRSAWLIALWLVVSLVVAIVWLCKDARDTTAMQHYIWSGWYRVFWFGFNIEILLLLVGLTALALARFVRWTVRRRSGKAA